MALGADQFAMQTPERTEPLHSAIQAAVRLLADPDPCVFETCRRQLLDWGDAAVPMLQEATRANERRLRVRARRVLRTLILERWYRDVAGFARAFGHRRDEVGPRELEAGVRLLLSVGQAERPLRQLDLLSHLVARLRDQVRGRTAASCARALGEVMAAEGGFGAHGVGHYDVEGLDVDRVVRLRRGVGLTLGIVYLIVGRRAGLRMSGVAVPGRFLVRVHGARSVLVDPTTGKPLTKSECLRDLRAKGYGGTPAAYLADLDDRQILVLLLDGLRRVIGYREDVEMLRVVLRARELFAAVRSS